MDKKDILLHYGVPGMKWGHRKSRNDIAKARRAARADNPDDEEHEDYKRTVTRKSLKSMSTKEIKAENERLQAEKTYMELTERKESAFEKAAKEVLMNVAKNSAQKFLSHYADAGVNKLTGYLDNNTALGNLFGTKKVSDVASDARDAFDAAKKHQEGLKKDEPKEESKKDEPKKDEPEKEESKKVERKEAEERVEELKKAASESLDKKPKGDDLTELATVTDVTDRSKTEKRDSDGERPALPAPKLLSSKKSEEKGEDSDKDSEKKDSKKDEPKKDKPKKEEPEVTYIDYDDNVKADIDFLMDSLRRTDPNRSGYYDGKKVKGKVSSATLSSERSKKLIDLAKKKKKK